MAVKAGRVGGAADHQGLVHELAGGGRIEGAENRRKAPGQLVCVCVCVCVCVFWNEGEHAVGERRDEGRLPPGGEAVYPGMSSRLGNRLAKAKRLPAPLTS